jgi:hypothetical protein
MHLWCAVPTIKNSINKIVTPPQRQEPPWDVSSPRVEDLDSEFLEVHSPVMEPSGAALDSPDGGPALDVLNPDLDGTPPGNDIAFDPAEEAPTNEYRFRPRTNLRKPARFRISISSVTNGSDVERPQRDKAQWLKRARKVKSRLLATRL